MLGLLRILLVTPFLLAALVATAAAKKDSVKVDNFVLLDQQGEAHELFYHRSAKAIVLITHGNGCQVVRSNLPDYQALRADYAGQGVEIFMLNANLQDSRKRIADEAVEWGFDFPILKDETQLIARSLQVNRTAEVLVVDPRSWEIVYRGPLNDRVDYERQKAKASKVYVRDVLDTLIGGGEPDYAKLASPGCIINIEEPSSDPISYAKSIVPILQEKCMACHVDGGIAPWAMSEYAMIKGFAPMIREVLRTKRMPPWHADPEVGHWQGNTGLSNEEKITLVNWIESGAPRGDGDDPLKAFKAQQPDWPFGEPDLIVEIPAFEVPASGEVDYRFPVVKNPLDRGVWVAAAAIIPGDPKAVHHILAGSSKEVPAEARLENVFENLFLSYGPGNEAARMPEGTGVYIEPGGVYQFQMHYTPYGKKSVDQSKLGLYFADKTPANFYREHVILNPALRIPANAAAHEQKAHFLFPRAAEIYALLPHAHYRGKSSMFELRYPDGKVETLLSVPNYDFNWQRTYRLASPKKVPAGTSLVHRTVYDNSVNNRGNPDPNSDVYWGLQSHEEMLYGSFGYRWLDETSDKPIHSHGEARLLQMIGFMDQNLDGQVAQAELTPRMKKRVGDQFAAFDVDSNGGLSVKELGAMMAELGREG